MLNHKHVISCTLIFLLSIHLVAQEKFIDATDKITRIVDLYKDNPNDPVVVNTILANFNNAGKVEQQHLNKSDVGICIVLTPSNLDYLITPAKYTYQNDKINLSAFRIRGTNALNDDMKDYVIRYQTDFKTIGESPFFAKLLQTKINTEGTLTENETEHIIEEPYTISFVRGDKDWTYIVSIDKAYKKIDKPQIIIYVFKKTLKDDDLFSTNNSATTKNKRVTKTESSKERYPLYHDVRIDYLRTALGELITFEPFKTDTTLRQYYSNIDERLDRFSIRNYTEELQYFATLDISEDFLKSNTDYISDLFSEIKNITHLSTHALGDIYLASGDYALAKEYYLQSLFTSPIQTNSGTTYSKDSNRIVFDLAKNAHNAGNKNEAYTYLISMLFEGDNNTAAKILNEYITSDNIDLKKFKKDLDTALRTLKNEDNYLHTFVFRKNEGFFIPMFSESLQTFQDNLKNSDFYKALE